MSTVVCGMVTQKNYSTYEKKSGGEGTKLELVLSCPKTDWRTKETTYYDLACTAWGKKADELEGRVEEGGWVVVTASVESKANGQYWNTDVRIDDVQPVG